MILSFHSIMDVLILNIFLDQNCSKKIGRVGQPGNPSILQNGNLGSKSERVQRPKSWWFGDKNSHNVPKKNSSVQKCIIHIKIFDKATWCL
jgi:hypothetical protein